MAVRLLFLYTMIKRPTSIWKKVFIRILISILIDLFLTVILIKMAVLFNVDSQIRYYVRIVKYIYFIPVDNYFFQVFLLFMLCSIIIHLKRIMIFIVRLYQLWAPEMMRKSCLFTPSCSEYMILSIEKYGCIKGFIKGVIRIRKCHTPNGGIDYP